MSSLDRSGRRRFTGNALVTIDRKMPGEQIFKFRENLAEFTNVLGFDGSAASFIEQSAFFPRLGAAVVPADPYRLRRFTKMNYECDGLLVGRERFLYTPRPVNSITAVVTPSPLEIMGVRDNHTGKVKVLILDNGFEANHPDFVTRKTNPMSFTADGLGSHDLTGHGTHCTGLTAGPKTPQKGPRYGVACEADISTGRVMENATGSATDKAILTGLEWALANGIAVVNLSLGTDVYFDEAFDPAFEEVASRVLDGGVLMIAAAGNDPDDTRHPVEHPANCPSVMAVAALDEFGNPAPYSCASVNADQYIDVAAPGANVRSAFCGDYLELTGTSMAAALVSGIAALWADSSPAPRGRDLWRAVATSNPGPKVRSRDVGDGLVQAPPP